MNAEEAKIELEELFADADKARRRDKHLALMDAAKPRRSAPKEEKPSALFADPKNWQRTRGIALIHADTQTLLGNFSEYRHRTVDGCRRLVKEDELLHVEGTESVAGDFWLGDRKETVVRSTVWNAVRELCINLHLPELQLWNPEADVRVCFEYGSIARVELAADTHFCDGPGPSMMVLPKGVDVYQVMALDAKVKLRAAIDAEEEVDG